MIRWVSHDLGTAPFAEGARCIDVVVVDVRNLLDRAGNDATTIRTHVDAARIALERGQRVLVCCDHGISRSNAIATAVLASARGISFDTALETVFAAAGHPEIRIEMLAEVRAACFPTDTHNTRSARRVLLTGGSGRLGQRLLLSVPAGVEVLAPGRDKLDLLSGPAQIEAFLRRHSIQSVMHFAQPRATNTNRSLGDALAMLRNVLDAAGTRGSPVFFPSNWLVLAGHTDNELLATETTPILPVTCLGEAKSLCEQLIAHYIQRKGLAATVLRSGPVVGAGIAPTFICNLRQLAATGANLCTHRYDNGLPALDLVSADDYAAAVWGLIETRSTGTFHAGAARLTSTQRMAELIAHAIGSTSRRTETRVHGTTCNVKLDASKLAETIGWRPEVGAEQAILRFALDPSPAESTTQPEEQSQ